MPTASPASARSAVRALLRAVRANVTAVSGSPQWRNVVVGMLRDRGAGGGSGGSDGSGDGGSDEQAHARLELARDVTFLINNVSHHKALLKSYNIGLDPDQRNKAMVEAVAKRVGFKLPEAEPNQ